MYRNTSFALDMRQYKPTGNQEQNGKKRMKGKSRFGFQTDTMFFLVRLTNMNVVVPSCFASHR